MLWWHKLPLVRLVIAKCRAHQWQRNSIYQFVWRLFSGPSATKSSQEDILQDLSNATRANRRKDVHMSRAMYMASTSERFIHLPVTPLTLKPGDLNQLGSVTNVTADDFVPRRMKTFENDTDRSAVLYSAIHKVKNSQGQNQDWDCPSVKSNDQTCLNLICMFSTRIVSQRRKVFDVGSFIEYSSSQPEVEIQKRNQHFFPKCTFQKRSWQTILENKFLASGRKD